MAPKKRGPQADPTLAPLPVRNKSAQQKYYHKKEEDKEHPQSWYVQRRRVYERIKKTGKLPQQRTIEKYGVVIENNRVVVPEDLNKPKVIVDWVPQPAVRVVHARMEEPHAVIKPVTQGTITSEVSNEYLDKHYTLGTTADSEVRKAKDSWVAKYRGLGKWLKSVGVLKDVQTGNLAEALDEYEKVLDIIKNMKVTKGDRKGAPVGPGTRNERLKIILLHLDENPNLKAKVSTDAYKAYREAQQDASMASGERTANAREEKSVYKWPDVMDKIEAKFGKYSRENMYARVYNEVPIRNELKNIPWLKDVKNPKKSNYVDIKSLTDIRIHINDFKTEAGVKAQVYKLSPEVCDIITTNMAERDETDKDEMRSLFPFPYDNESSLWVWFGKAIAEAGFPKYPYGLTKEPGKDETMNGTRHAVATWRNSAFNKFDLDNPEPFGAELAAKMLHTLKTSESVYRNTGFLDTPGSGRPPLKVPATQRQERAAPPPPPTPQPKAARPKAAAPVPDAAPRRVEVTENGKKYRGTVSEKKLKNGRFLITWDDPNEPLGEYTAAEVKKYLIK